MRWKVLLNVGGTFRAGADPDAVPTIVLMLFKYRPPARNLPRQSPESVNSKFVLPIGEPPGIGASQ